MPPWGKKAVLKTKKREGVARLPLMGSGSKKNPDEVPKDKKR